MLTRYPHLEGRLRLDFLPVGNAQPRTLTPADIDAFNQRGYLGPRRLFAGEPLRQLQAFFREREKDVTSTGDTFESFHHRLPELTSLVTHPATMAILTDLLGPNVVCHVTQFINKPPGQTRGGSFHQDATFNATDARAVVVWLAIEDADAENGCMEFIPGSHKAGVVECDQGHFVIEPVRYGRPIAMPAQAGEALFFSDLLMHSSPPNRSRARYRPAFTATYCAAEIEPHENVTRWAVVCAGKDPSGKWASSS